MIVMLLEQVLYYGDSTLNNAYVCWFFCMFKHLQMLVYQPFSNFISEDRNFNGITAVSNLYCILYFIRYDSINYIILFFCSTYNVRSS